MVCFDLLNGQRRYCFALRWGRLLPVLHICWRELQRLLFAGIDRSVLRWLLEGFFGGGMPTSVFAVLAVLGLAILLMGDIGILEGYFSDVVVAALLELYVVVEQEAQELLLLLAAEVAEVDNWVTGHLTTTFIYIIYSQNR